MSNTEENTNALLPLVGKTITSVSVRNHPYNGGQAYIIRTSDGESYTLASETFGKLSMFTTETLLEAVRQTLADDSKELDSEPEVLDECCQRCSNMFFPHEVIILDDLGPVCKDCCTVADVALAVSQGSLDTDGETPEEFLEQWRADEPV